MIPRLALALDLLAWTALAMLLLALVSKALYHITAWRSQDLRRDIAQGKAPPLNMGLAWWTWAPSLLAAVWLLSGWLR